MREYWVRVHGDKQHRVRAEDEMHAIEVWLDEQGYDSIDHAAREYHCQPEDFTASETGRHG